jgi:hypothetical protein
VNYPIRLQFFSFFRRRKNKITNRKRSKIERKFHFAMEIELQSILELISSIHCRHRDMKTQKYNHKKESARHHHQATKELNPIVEGYLVKIPPF